MAEVDSTAVLQAQETNPVSSMTSGSHCPVWFISFMTLTTKSGATTLWLMLPKYCKTFGCGFFV